ncbi:mitotic checkpoint protein BUB3.1 [Tanacetum coccineum]
MDGGDLSLGILFFAFGNAHKFISFGYVAQDPRGASAQERALVGIYAQPELVYFISLVGNRVVLATVGCHVNVYNLRNMLALSFMEGRVAIEFFELTEAGQSKNCGTFATGGCDGFVNVWDGNNKKRLYQYPKYPTSFAALSFSKDGRLLAVASSYTYEEGEIFHEPDAIFVRSVNEVEVKPKTRSYGYANRQ